MPKFQRLAWLLLLAVVQLTCCTTANRNHLAQQAPPRARRAYHEAERHNHRARKHSAKRFLPWN